MKARSKFSRRRSATRTKSANSGIPRREAKGTRPRVAEPVNQGRHEAQCAVCSHPHREELERDWLDWGSTSRIASAYRVSRDSIYRHAHALGLFIKRQRNIRKALERMIEQAETVEVTAPAVVSAIQAYAKINSQGQRKLSRLLRKVTDQTATDDERIGAAVRFFVTLGVEDDLSCGLFLLAAMKILSGSANLQGLHSLSNHFKEIDRIMDALLAAPRAALASPRLQ